MMRLSSPCQLLLLAGLLVLGLPRLARGDAARVRVINFVELSARACERDPDKPYAGPDHVHHECGAAAEDPPAGCKCTPYPPTYLELKATIASAAIPAASYRRPTEYQSVQLDSTQNASCTVQASSWKGVDDIHAPVVIQTSLVLKANLDYSLLLVGYLDRASYRPDSGEILPGKFGELYAVLVEDAAPPPRSHMGTIRLINVSPATSLLLGRISDNGRKLADFVPDGTAYVCRRPDECKDTNSRSCVPVAFDWAFPPGPPPPPATCDPNHKDKKTGNYEGCPAFDQRAHRAYSCIDRAVKDPCQRNPPCSSPAGYKGCEPDWDVGKTMDPPITNATVCQRCKCEHRRIVNPSAKAKEAALSNNDSYCMMGLPATTECPGEPRLHYGSLDDPCPGPTGHLPSTTCWRAVDPDYPDYGADTIPCDNCITDRRPWSEKCYACPCPAGNPAPPPAPCGPWANPTKSNKRPRQDKAYLISQKKYDGRTQTPVFAIGVEEVPVVDLPAGVHTIELLDGKLPYPIHKPLRADVNVPVGKAVTVFLHGLPPSKPAYPNGHPASPLGLDFVTGDLVQTFAHVKIASTVEGLSLVKISANQTVGSAISPLRLRLGDANARTEVDVHPFSVEFLRLDVPSYAINRRGEWGSYAHYEIGLRSASSGSISAVPLDTSKGPESVYVVVSGDKSDPKLNTYVNPPLPSAGELTGMAVVRVINAANGVDSLTVQATNANSATPISVASSVGFDTSSSDYTKIPVGTYQLEARSSGIDDLTGTLTKVFLYEGLAYTVVVGSDSKTLKLVLSLDRSYNSQATVRARCAYLGGEPDRNIGGTAPPAQIKWSVGGIDGAVSMQAPVVVPEGEVSDYSSVALPGTFDTHFKSFRVYLRLSIMWEDSYSDPLKEIECFTQLLPLDMETHNNTAWTFVVWGSQSGRTCNVITDFSHTRDLLVLPDPSKAGVRVLVGGTHRPSFQLATVQGSDTIVVKSQTSQLGSGYAPVPASITRITLADSTDQVPFDQAIVAGSLYSLFVRYGTKDRSKLSSTPAFADDINYGSHYSFTVRFLNALSSGPAVALTLHHGQQNLNLGIPAVSSPLLAEAMHRTQLVSASCFTTPGAWVQAWSGNTWSRVQVALPTQPVETIKPNTCPPHCPLAEGAPIVAPTPDKPQTVILGNDTTSPASPFLVAVEDDITAPELCNARVRLISLVSATISAKAKLGSQEHQISSPGLSPTPQNREPPTELSAGHWEFTFPDGSPSSSCDQTLQSGRSYSLYVTSTAVDAGRLPIYTCKVEVDKNYHSVGYVRLANAAGSQNRYSMTFKYKGESAAANCAAVKNLPTTRAVDFGEQSGYTPVSVYGTTTYQVTVQQPGSAAPPTSKDIDLVAGKNWTIYALPPRDPTMLVELQAVADDTAAPWTGGDDEVGLRVLDGLPEGPVSSAQWSWKYCDVGEDDCKGASTLAAVGNASGRYQTAAIHGYSQWLPPRRRWRLGLQVARGADKVFQEFGSSYTPITSCEDGTTAVPLRAGGKYTAVLTKTGSSHGSKSVLMFQDRDGESHSWWSTYGLLVGLVVVMVVLLLALLAWCATKWSGASLWKLALYRCLDWFGKLCGRGADTRDGGSQAETEEGLMDSAFERGASDSE